MNLDKLERKLVAAARNQPPGDEVPYAFEKRVMARIMARTISDVWAVWGQALWRSAGVCLAVVLLLAAISVFIPTSNAPAPGDLSLDFQKTMLAAMDTDYSR